MMFKQLSFILLFSAILILSCEEKNEFTPVKVTYYVKIADSNTVNIAYNSDYYYDSGSRKAISYTSKGGIWVASHMAYEQEDYYIKVDYTGAFKPDSNFQVKVIFDDNLVKDSVAHDTIVTPVELSGVVTN